MESGLKRVIGLVNKYLEMKVSGGINGNNKGNTIMVSNNKINRKPQKSASL